MDRLLIGVEGGGTRTRVVFVAWDGTRLACRDGGPGLVDPREPAASAARVLTLVRDAASEADLTLPAAALCAGLAGASTDAIRKQIASALESGAIAERVEVVADGLIALEGALAGQPGILLVSGTGSVAYGRDPAGRIERAGGRGLVVGDEGSGYAIAIAGLRACLRAHDGRMPSTRLLGTILTELGLDHPDEISGWAGRADKSAIAALAPQVMEAAAAGDPVASAILNDAADELALHVYALIRRLGPWSDPVTVVFYGGALAERDLARRVEERLETATAEVVVRKPVADGVAGALERARRLADPSAGGR